MHKIDTYGSRRVKTEMERVKGLLRGQTLMFDDLVKEEISIVRYCQQQRVLKEIAALSAGSLCQRTV